MRIKVREGFDRIKLDDDKKQEILSGILTEAKAGKKRRRNMTAVAACTAFVLAAAVFTAVLLSAGADKEGKSAYVPKEAQGGSLTIPTAGKQLFSLIACRVVMSINPSVEFQLGEDGMVVAVVGLNEDGAALIEGIDFAGLSMENATIVVVNRLIQQNYISASMVDDVYISVSGTPKPDTLEMMSIIIKTAASQYELSVDTVQTKDNELQIVMGETNTPEITGPPEVTDGTEVTVGPEVTGSPDETDIPDVTLTPEVTPPTEPTSTASSVPAAPIDVDALTEVLTLKYLKDFRGSVDDIRIDFGGKRVNSDIDAYIDIAGRPVMAATFQTLNKLIAQGHIADDMPDTKVEFDVTAFGIEAAANVRELAALMMQEAGLALSAVDEGGGRFCLAASGLPVPERTARYTFLEIDDPALIKAREDITELQMQILKMSFTAEEIDYMLTPRYWAVMPDIIGLDEERAAELLTLSGIKPVPTYEDGDHTGGVDYGQVFYHDANAGCLIEVGSRLYMHVRAHSMPSFDTDDLPDVLQYLPAFLDDTGHATVTVNRDTGMGVPIAFAQEGYDVVIHAFGGGWKNADGLHMWNEQYISTGSDEAGVYWAADNGEGDDVPHRANLVYEIYRQGEYVASVLVNLTLVSTTEAEALTYEAQVAGFGEDGPYSYLELY